MGSKTIGIEDGNAKNKQTNKQKKKKSKLHARCENKTKKFSCHSVTNSLPLDPQDARPDVLVLGLIISKLASTNPTHERFVGKKKRGKVE